MAIAGILSGGLDLQSGTVAAITAGAALLSGLAAVLALVVSLRIARTGRKNANTWAMYQGYNSKSVRLGRKTARDIIREGRAGFTSQDDYYAYFAPGNLPANYALPPRQDAANMQRLREQSLHDLMAFYHQVGLLLEKRELDKDFTLLLLGGGLADRWQALDGLPPLWAERGDFPYGGMYVLYQTYLKWKKHEFRRLSAQYKKARATLNAQIAKEQA